MSPVLVAYGITILTWASAFPAIRVALEGYGPVQLALFRYLLGSLVLGIYATATRRKLPPLGDFARIAGLGAMGIAGYSAALSFGQQHVPAGAASFLIATAPVWMLVIAAVAAGETPRPGIVAAMGISLAGVSLIASAGGHGFTLNVYALAILAAAVLQAIMAILQRPLIVRHGALTFTMVAVWGAAAALLPFGGGLAAAARAAPAASTAAVIWLALVPGIAGSAMWAFATARSTAAAAGTALYLVPVVAMALARLVLGETPAPLALAGAALVLVGVATASSPLAWVPVPPRFRLPRALPAAAALSSSRPRSGSRSLPTT